MKRAATSRLCAVWAACVALAGVGCNQLLGNEHVSVKRVVPQDADDAGPEDDAGDGTVQAGRGVVGGRSHTGAGDVSTGGRGGAGGTGTSEPAVGNRVRLPAAANGGEGGGGGGGAGGAAGAAGAGTAAPPPPPCMTHITYSAAWIKPSDHPDTNYDDVTGQVTWDGSFEIDAVGNTKITLSNGFEPFFAGKTQAAIALDVTGPCAPTEGCRTRVTYGSAWKPSPDHTSYLDDTEGKLTTDGQCITQGNASALVLSNGWVPEFTGANACEISLRYTQCGGL